MAFNNSPVAETEKVDQVELAKFIAKLTNTIRCTNIR